MELTTPRLFLRFPRQEDTDEYMSFCHTEFVLKYNAMTVSTRDGVEAMLMRSAMEENMLVMEERSTGRLLGAVFFNDDSLPYGVASRELSYFLREEVAGQGYMTEALSAVIRHLFAAEPELECISARSFEPNIASRKLLEKLGFRHEGTIRRCVRGYGDIVYDDTLYSLLRQDYVGRESSAVCPLSAMPIFRHNNPCKSNIRRNKNVY